MTINEKLMCPNTTSSGSSIVITTIKERRQDLFELLKCLTCQIVKPCEVIVVCAEKIEVPIEIITKYQELGIRFKLLQVSSELTLGTTRNLGIKNTQAEYVYFIDDDALPTQFWLMELNKSLQTGVDVVGGVSRPFFKSGFITPIWWDEALIGPYVAVGNQYVKFKHASIWGCNFAIRKDAIKKIGYFDERLGLRKFGPKLLWEDSEFVMRAVRNGLAIDFNPHAIVYHKLDAKRINFSSLRLRAIRAGRTWKELNKMFKFYKSLAFIKEILFKAFRGPYFVLMQKSKATALPVYMLLLIYEIIGWSGFYSE